MPAESAGFATNESMVLRHQRRRPLDTVRAVYLALVARGGHRDRNGAGPPGWPTRWLGRRRQLGEGVNLAAQLLDV